MRNLKKKPIQVYIEPQQDRALTILSKRQGVSKAHLIREGIVRLLKDLPAEEDPAMGLIDRTWQVGEGRPLGAP
jgi:hypothetical protein